MSIKTSLGNLREALLQKINQKNNEIAEKEAELEKMAIVANGPIKISRSDECTDALGVFVFNSALSDKSHVCPFGSYYRYPTGYSMEYVNNNGIEFPYSWFVSTDAYGNIKPVSIDCSQIEGSRCFTDEGTNYKVPNNVRRFLFPEASGLPYNFFECVSKMAGGLYLPSYGTVNSEWIKTSTTVEIPVKCPQGSTLSYYLNRFGVSAEDAVGIFENLAEIKYSNRITLGSKNLAKLTKEQKNIAYKKGWDLA